MKMIVAALNSNGEPDFYFCIVKCTSTQRQEGAHYDLAERMARKEGYEPRLSFDESDPAGKAILPHFAWESASEFTV
jgi:hypothetical protein